MFYRNGAWSKPVGVSQIYIMLIGGGGPGDLSTTYGSSGNVTVWFGAAQNVPNNLVVSPAIAQTASNNVGNSSNVSYNGSSLVTLLTATGGKFDGSANTADAAGTFGISGFYQNVLGQPGNLSSSTPSATTFLSGGANGAITSNYGYEAANGDNGYFMLQPIIVGVASGSSARNNAIGCGSPRNSSNGSPGFVLIASW